MKKFFLHLLFTIILLTPYRIYADACKIKEGPAPVLEDYIEDLDTIISNLGTSLESSGSSNNIQKDYRRIKADIVEGFNLLISWDGYFSKIDYYIILPLKTSVPYEVKRDHENIKKELEGLNKYLSSLIKNNYQNQALEKEQLCFGVMGKCELEGEAQEVVIKLIGNTLKIIDLYRLSVTDEDYKFDYSKLILVKDNFKQEFSKYYNYHTISDCSEEGGFMERIRKKIKEISENLKWGSEGMKEWRKAWALLNGSISLEEYIGNYQERERELLRAELSRQGIGGSNAEIIMGNLERYNENGGYPEGYNPFSITITDTNNFFSTIGKQIQKFRRKFNQNANTAMGDEDNTSIIKIKDTTTKVELTKKIKERVAKTFLIEVDYAHSQDNANTLAQSKLFEMHISIVNSIEILNKTIPISEKVCKAQAQGLGICSF